MHKIQSIILAGGNGERLWPSSNEQTPKQFLKLSNGRSPLQNTLLRNKEISPMAVIVSEKNIKIAKKQIAEIGVKAKIIAEPYGKNTAACSIIAALFTESEGANRTILLPVDHLIKKHAIYVESVKKAAIYANAVNIVTIGIKPSDANIGYGYLKVDKNYNNSMFHISQFVEKPNQDKATQYINSGDYYWNSGIFIYNPQCLIEIAKNLAPEIYYFALEAFNKRKVKNNVIRLGRHSYRNIIADSLDYAFMEKYRNILMMKSKFYWKDVGSWDALWDISKKDKNRNFIKGEAFIYSKDVEASVIYSEKIPTAVMGLKDVVVVNTEGASLIMHKSYSHKVKEAKKILEKKGAIRQMKPCNDNFPNDP